MHTIHLFTGALDIGCAHLFGDALPLFLCDWSQTLSLEDVDTGAFGAKIGFQSNEDEGRCRAEMQDFGIPLKSQIESGFVLISHC